jgi:hypothetical protein
MVVKTKYGDVEGVFFINYSNDYVKAQRVAQLLSVNKLGDIVKRDVPAEDIIGVADFTDVPIEQADLIKEWYWRNAR